MRYSADFFDELIEQELSYNSPLRRDVESRLEEEGYDSYDIEEILDGGGVRFSTNELYAMSARLRELIIQYATQNDLPTSVENDVLNCTSSFYQEDYGGRVEIKLDIRFSNDLSRNSLRYTRGKRKGEYTGEGIENIVSLFNSGYESSYPIKYGYWETHGIIIKKTPTHREGLHFLDNAVETLLQEYPELKDAGYYLFGDMSDSVGFWD